MGRYQYRMPLRSMQKPAQANASCFAFCIVAFSPKNPIIRIRQKPAGFRLANNGTRCYSNALQ